VISSHIADKDIAVVAGAGGGTTQIAVESSCRRRACVTEETLKQLSLLAAKCEQLFGATTAGHRVWGRFFGGVETKNPRV
jgi:hypothetical protein